MDEAQYETVSPAAFWDFRSTTPFSTHGEISKVGTRPPRRLNVKVYSPPVGTSSV